jgi:hypothetical protein
VEKEYISDLTGAAFPCQHDIDRLKYFPYSFFFWGGGEAWLVSSPHLYYLFGPTSARAIQFLNSKNKQALHYLII